MYDKNIALDDVDEKHVLKTPHLMMLLKKTRIAHFDDVDEKTCIKKHLHFDDDEKNMY